MTAAGSTRHEQPADTDRSTGRQPRVSVLMPARNVGRYIAEAISSIIGQTFAGWELIVLDDGSTDDTAAVARRFADSRIRVVSDGQHRGRSARLNQGVGLSRGTYIARMDADDVSFPERLETQVRFLDAHPEVDLVSNNMLVTDEDGLALGTLRWRGGRHEDIVSRPSAAFHFGQGTCMGRADWFRRWPYDERRRRAEDDDQMLRSYRKSRFERIPNILYAYRKPPPSLRSLAVARWDFMGSLLATASRNREPRLALGILRQTLLLVVEAAVMATGRGDLWLRGRLHTLGADDRANWDRVRQEVRERVRRANVPVTVL